MNGLIEKLAEQTDLLSEFTPTKIPGLYSGYISEEQILRFAELIVRECIEMSTGQNQYKLGFQLAKEFKEHFGVKE